MFKSGRFRITLCFQPLPSSAKTDEREKGWRAHESSCARRFPQIDGERRKGNEFVTFRGGGGGKQFCRKAATDAERESSRTAGAYPIGESNLDYRKFMGMPGVCTRVSAYARHLSERHAVSRVCASERAANEQQRCLRGRNTEIIQRACFRKGLILLFPVRNGRK